MNLHNHRLVPLDLHSAAASTGGNRLHQAIPKQLPCFCASLRQATRIITQLYDGVLRPVGLTSTQYNLLEAIGMVPEIRTGEIAGALAMDSTTVTRSLKLIENAGWIRAAAVEDRRERRWTLTARGKAKLASAHPYWQTAQKRVSEALGGAEAARLQELGHKLVLGLRL
jgi:DNA-binding MarR family transcriptional regulator